MKKKNLNIIIVLCATLLICVAMLCACNDTKKFSDEIFITDFSETKEITIEVDVKNHSILPDFSRVFEYKKDINKLYEEIVSSPKNRNVRLENGVIIVDKYYSCRYYSCIIYKDAGDNNKYIVHSMAYSLGEWADNKAIFFPAYTLDKEISSSDDANTVYNCKMGINELKNYYTERGYLATITDNVLRVVTIQRYPTKFEGYYGDKALAWSVVYVSENQIKFADIGDEFEI